MRRGKDKLPEPLLFVVAKLPFPETPQSAAFLDSCFWGSSLVPSGREEDVLPAPLLLAVARFLSLKLTCLPGQPDLK